MPSTDLLLRWLKRLGVAGLLLGTYFTVWTTTVRTAYVTHVARPLLQAAAPASWSIETGGGGRALYLQQSSGHRGAGHTAPAGVRFLLPALLLVFIAPDRLYWLALWTGHCLLGLLSLAMLAAGCAGLGVGFTVNDFVTQYLVDAFSLGVAVVGVVREFELGLPLHNAGSPPS